MNNDKNWVYIPPNEILYEIVEEKATLTDKVCGQVLLAKGGVTIVKAKLRNLVFDVDMGPLPRANLIPVKLGHVSHLCLWDRGTANKILTKTGNGRVDWVFWIN